MKAMILAAGLGSRLRPLTDTVPKPLLKVGSQCLIEYHLHALQQIGVQEVVINVCHLAKQIMNYLGDGSRYDLQIHYSFEKHSCLGTGGGIYRALPLLGPKPFILISADIFTHFNFASLPQQPLGLAHLVLVDNPIFHPQGDFGLETTGVATLTGKKLTYANIAVLHPDLFAQCEPSAFPLAPLFKDAINKKEITGEYYQGFWENVSSVEQFYAINEKWAMETLR